MAVKCGEVGGPSGGGTILCDATEIMRRFLGVAPQQEEGLSRTQGISFDEFGCDGGVHRALPPHLRLFAIAAADGSAGI
ncbi:MAG: hypothetical protein QUV05_01530 [Phycisphaerae bacterium]|nr:hypothetical protein [Phycisphaerae bacterium]